MQIKRAHVHPPLLVAVFRRRGCVRDAADLPLLALTHPQAAGQRSISVAGLSLAPADVADIPRAEILIQLREVSK